MRTGYPKYASTLLSMICLLALLSTPVKGQGTVDPQHLLRYSAALDSTAGVALPSVAGMTFGLYSEPAGGSALWMESQNVGVDASGHYSVLLGAQSANGIPSELFTVGGARWLGVQVAGQGSETRVPLTNVPYAVQAGDAQTLGGHSAEEYALASQVGAQIRKELVLAGYNVSSASAADALPRGNAQPTNPGPPADQVNLSTINDKLIAMDAKVSNIINILNHPPFLGATLCTEPSIGIDANLGAEVDGYVNVEGRVGAEAFGNGAIARIMGDGKIGVDAKLHGGWDVLKLGLCLDIAALIQNLTAPPAADSPQEVRQLYASLKEPDAVAATPTLVDQFQALDKTALVNKLLSVASTLKLDPAVLQQTIEKITTANFDISPLSVLQPNDPSRTALLAAMPIPDQLRPIIQNPNLVMGKIDQLKSAGLCTLKNDPNLPQDVRNVINTICTAQAAEPFQPLLNGLQTTVGQVQSSITAIKGVVDSIYNLIPKLDAGVKVTETSLAQ